MVVKKSQSESVHFRVLLTPIQKTTILVAVLFIVLIALVTLYSPTVRLSVLGIFLNLLGAILLGLGLIKTNDELIDLGSHHVEFDKQRFVSHLTKDRFFIVLGVFLMVLGALLQIVGVQLAN